MGGGSKDSTVSDAARDELVREAVETKIDRDRWRRRAEELQRVLDGPGDDHDLLLWRIWHDRATEAAERIEQLGTVVALADRAVRAVVKDGSLADRETQRSLLDYRRALQDLVAR